HYCTTTLVHKKFQLSFGVIAKILPSSPQSLRDHRGCTARPWPQPTMESEPEFLAKTQRSQATKKRREPNLEFLRLGSFASLREKSCSKNKKLRTCSTDPDRLFRKTPSAKKTTRRME